MSIPEQREFTPIQFELGELDTDAIKAEMEAEGYRWDYVEAAIDFLSQPELIKKKLGLFMDLDPNEEERLMSAIEQTVEYHIKNYTAGNNVEAIRVYDGGNYRAYQFIAKKIRESLTF